MGVKSCIGYNDIIENNILFFLRNNYEIDTKINFCIKFIVLYINGECVNSYEKKR